MKFFTVVFASLAVLAAPIFGAPTESLISVTKVKGEVNKGSFIVKLKDNVSKDTHLNWLSQHVGSDAITHRDWQTNVLHGFAGQSDFILSILFTFL